jgi:hypothetical protein
MHVRTHANTQETELHVASRTDDARGVAQLLEAGQIDPAARDSWGRTPYTVAASKEVRDAFRRAMGAEPDKWDWTAAGVPSALTDELQAAQAAKQVSKAGGSGWTALRVCVIEHQVRL